MNAPLKEYPIILTQDLVWGDMDAFQHLNNTVYFRYFEDARMVYFEKLGVMELMTTAKVGPILASTSSSFKVPLKYPDTLSIGARISDIQAKKFSMDYLVYSHTQNSIAAEGQGLIVYFDYANGHSCEVPLSIVNKIKEFEGSPK